MKIAVVGGGISGLICSYLLRDKHEVVLFEKEPRLGGHTHTVDVSYGDQSYAIDTGFIVYNNRTYPNFIKFLNQLGVSGQPTQMSFSVSCERSGVEYGSVGFNGLFAQRGNLLNPSHYRMLRDILRFNRESKKLLTSPSKISIGDYLEQNGYSQEFMDRYLLPMCAAIWSGSLDVASQFPADHFVEFFNNHGLLTVTQQPQWYVIKGGSRSYVQAAHQLLGERIRLDSQVSSVKRIGQQVEIVSRQGKETFDRVIFACHSDEALALLDDPSQNEIDILSALPYQTNEVLLHTDRRLLPVNPRAWASWNYRVSDDRQRPATVTYHMNRLQGISAPVEFCVTLNQTQEVDQEQVLGRYHYDHPVYTLAAQQARERRDEINGQALSYYCGAYWGNGFHEDGVKSALDVCAQLGGHL